ncbi:hypothetical protein OROMI_033436 [Orobanche minor]
MKTLTVFFSRTREPNSGAISHRNGESSGGAGEGGETIDAAGDGDTKLSGDGERKRESMEVPPDDDVCPICFGNFDVPCRAPCGHWYCGSCILQYWNFSAALRPCKCPMCSQLITKLMPDASFCHRREAENSKVLRSVGDYNRLFGGGVFGFMMRMFLEMLNADRPGVYLREMRVVALFFGVMYSFIPFDFLRIGHRNIRVVFDYSAVALSFILYLVGLYLRRRRRRNVRQLVDMQAVQD